MRRKERRILLIDLEMKARGSSVEEMVLGLWRIKGLFLGKSEHQGAGEVTDCREGS